jgi:hypothetical protein
MNTPLHAILLRVLRYDFGIMRSLPGALNGAAAVMGRTPNCPPIDAHAIVAFAGIGVGPKHITGLRRSLATVELMGVLSALTFAVVLVLRAVTRLA